MSGQVIKENMGEVGQLEIIWSKYNSWETFKKIIEKKTNHHHKINDKFTHNQDKSHSWKQWNSYTSHYYSNEGTQIWDL